MSGFALFETSIGMCALAWGPQGTASPPREHA